MKSLKSSDILTLFTLDYMKLFSLIQKDDLVYLDPPYQGTGANGGFNYLENININEFLDFLHELNRKNIAYILSFDGIHSPMHLLSPVIDALDKAQLERENVDAVLFIGGSCLNPLVRNCVMDYMNEYDDCVESILPSDLRSHVSLCLLISKDLPLLLRR